MYRLYCFAQSGNSLKVALTLQLLRQPWEAVHVDYFSGITRDPAWRAEFNEQGELPVLEFEEDGEPVRLSQSALLMNLLAERHADVLPSLAGRSLAERRDVQRWLLFDNHKFTSYLATYRFQRSFAATPPEPAVLVFLKSRIDAAFTVVERRLEQTPFLTGPRLSLADLSLVAYLLYPAEEFGGDLLAGYPRLQGWVHRLAAVPGFGSPYTLLPGGRIEPRRW